MVGRILSYLKARGVLKEAPRNGILVSAFGDAHTPSVSPEATR